MLPEPAGGVLRAAGEARVAPGGHADLAEADPREEAADVAVVLPHEAELVERTPVDEPEVPGVGWDLDVAQPAQDAVEEPDRGAAEEGLDAPVLADRVDDLVAFAPAGDQVGRELRRILEIAVHDDDRVARRAVEAGRDRHLVAEVAREPEHLETGVAPAQVREQVGAPVRAAVVDEDHLGGAVQAVEHGTKSTLQLRQRLLLVEDRDDEGVARGVHGTGPMVEDANDSIGSSTQASGTRDRLLRFGRRGRETGEEDAEIEER